MPATVGLILLRKPMIAMMFEHGENFDEHSTQIVAWALLWYTAGLIGHCLVEIFSRAFYALHNTVIPVVVGVLAMALNIGLSFFFVGLFDRLGWMPHGGLALANSLATGLEGVVLWLLMRNRLGGIEGRYIILGAWQATLGAGVMGLALWIWLSFFGEASPWITGLGGILVGGLVYGGMMMLLQVKEAQSLINIFRQRLQRLI
jgi:putative peptidoglycan lipid II flippase